MRWILLGLLLGLSGCMPTRFISPDNDFAVYDRIKQPLAVQPEYYHLWLEVEKCSGLHRDWGHVKFYVLDMDVWGLPIHGMWLAAYWNEPDNSITFLERYVHDPRIVKHEMLHSLIGKGGHPKELFIDACDVM
jgi:hypothetical protein